ncbi:MAG: phosphatase [Spirochaetaceae bacterium]|jgi:putative hydrolase|nr:phosphatase [Spirochaetaceae bacterium]
MKIDVDTHVHSIASGHAYSTIDELARGAKKRRLKGFVLSEHGPALQGFPHPYYFTNLKILPDIHGVRIFHGVELNVMDDCGGVDLNPKVLRHLDFVMVGFHEACFPPQSTGENTKALIAMLANPFVDGISHPGNPVYPLDYEEVVKAAARYGKVLEINNSSFKVSRRGSEPNCRLIAKLIRQYGVLTSCGSDAHYQADVGNFQYALKLITEENIHQDQVVNSSFAKFIEYSEKRKTARRAIS